MPDGPGNPVLASRVADRRRSYRQVLMLLLLLTVCVGAWEYRRPTARTRVMDAGPQPIAKSVVHDGAKIRVVHDLPYSYQPGVPLAELSMDLFIPESAANCPVLIYCHGGGWIGGNKNGIGPKSLYFASRGILVASVNYRLAAADPRRNGAIDIADAIRFLHHEVGALGGDPKRMFLMGHSAGAHLGALAICDPKLLGGHPAGAGIRGAILLDGSAYDVPALMQSDKAKAFKRAFGRSPSDWIAVSPYHYALQRRGLPPMILVHAGGEPIRRMSAQRLAAALRANGSKATLADMPGRDHYSVETSIGTPDDPLTPLIERFIRDDGKLD